MPSYKVTYFNLKALGEPIRLILSHAGVDFVDERIERSDWPKLKSNMTFGQLPILEVDGKEINQSKAICRYLAKQYGLDGANDWENLEIDATVDTIYDFIYKNVDHYYEENAEAKAEKLKAAKELVPVYVDRLDEQVKKNGGYFVGGKLTWADLLFVALLDLANNVAMEDTIAKAENLKALRDKVLDLPNIKAWVAKSPDTEY